MKQWQLTKIHEFMRATYWNRATDSSANPILEEYTNDEVWQMCEWIRADLRLIDEIRNME